jgi:hypothetical protein
MSGLRYRLHWLAVGTSRVCWPKRGWECAPRTPPTRKLPNGPPHVRWCVVLAMPARSVSSSSNGRRPRVGLRHFSAFRPDAMPSPFSLHSACPIGT